jgi:hypothetical protein
MQYAVEMASSGMINISVFIKIGSGIQSCAGYTYRHTHTGSKVIS